MSEAGPPNVCPDGPTRRELAERERAVLKAIEGVTSVKVYERTEREKLNKDMLNVRVVGKPAPISLHCSKNLPDQLALAELALQRVAAVLGTDAVAEGRRRAEAAAPLVAAAPPACAQRRPAEQPGFFERSRQIQRLESELIRAHERVRDADSEVKAARLQVAAEERAVMLADAQLASAKKSLAAASEPLLKAKAEAAEMRAELEKLRSKRQRAGEEPSAAADAAAGGAAQTEAAARTSPPPHSETYNRYTLEAWRRLEAEEDRRRSVIPERGVQRKPPRKGKDGALTHQRRGLVGAVQSWADGSIENVILLMVRLIEHFKVRAEVCNHFAGAPAPPSLPITAHATAAC